LITLFDADQAGVQATLRSLPLFLEEEMAGKMVALPKGEDPDGFLRKGNQEDLEKRVNGAISLVDFFFERLIKTYDLKSIDGKVKVAKEGMALLGRIPDRIRRDFYVKALAERLDVKESFLYEMLQSSPKESSRAEEEFKRSSADRTSPKSEEMVVRLMVHYPELIPALSEEGIFKEFESAALQKIAEGLRDLYHRKGRLDLPEALAQFEEDLKGRLCELAFQESGLEGGARGKILQDCIQKIREKRLKREKSELLKKIKEAEKQQEEKRVVPLLKEHQELAKKERSFQKEGIRKG
jgi:DNA primase